MAVSDLVWLAFAFGAGIVLGVFYFGGLWLTVRKIPSASRPALLTLCSFLVRLSVTFLGFYMVMAGRWERLLALLLGFLIVRTTAVRRLGPGSKAV